MEDSKIFVAIPGVGPRLAEKILLELKPKIERLVGIVSLDLAEHSQRIEDTDLESEGPWEGTKSSSSRVQIFR